MGALEGRDVLGPPGDEWASDSLVINNLMGLIRLRALQRIDDDLLDL